MNWKPIVVGVDGSPESARAAAFGAMVARRACASYALVSALPDRRPGMLRVQPDARSAAAHDRARIRVSLSGCLPLELSDPLEVHVGDPVSVLTEATERLGAGLIVVGSRRHRGLRSFSELLAHDLMRRCDVPLLVTGGRGQTIRRVLVALDLRPGSAHTFAAARLWAQLFGAALRVLHVTPSSPAAPDADAEVLASGLWSEIADSHAEVVVRVGDAATRIAEEADRWHADLLVLGSQQPGWAERVAIGSTAEHLVRRPPVATLVIPSRLTASRLLDIGALPWEERAGIAAG